MTKREQFFLKKIYEDQIELTAGVKKYNIKSHADLGSADPIVRRGFIHAVADIFELIVPLSDEVKNKLPLNIAIIKQFRDTAAHSYGTITNPMAYACITHCTDKNFMRIVHELSTQMTTGR